MTTTLTKAELADLLFDKVGLNKREAKDMVETFFEQIRAQLEQGESVKLSGFGNFQLRDKPQRPGRNPKTGEEIPITARRVVTTGCGQGTMFGDLMSELGGLSLPPASEPAARLSQAALYGLLKRVRDTGLTLIAVNQIQSKQEQA